MSTQRLGIGVASLIALILAGWDAFMVIDFLVFFDPSRCGVEVNCVGPIQADVVARGMFTVTALAGATLGGWIALKAAVFDKGVASLAVSLVGLSLAMSVAVMGGHATIRALSEGFQWALGAVFLAALVCGFAGLLRFFALFPTPISAEAVNASSILKGARWTVPLAQSSSFWTWTVATVVALAAITALPLFVDVPADLGDLEVGLLGFLFLGPVLGYAIMEVSFASGGEEARRRLWWLRWGLFASLTAFVLSATAMGLYLAGFDSWLVFGVAMGCAMLPVPILIASLAIAVLYDGAVDARLAIGKTTVYGVLGFLFVVLFSVVESVVSEVVEARLNWPGMIGTGASGAIVAAIIVPLRGAVSRKVSGLLPMDG